MHCDADLWNINRLFSDVGGRQPFWLAGGKINLIVGVADMRRPVSWIPEMSIEHGFGLRKPWYEDFGENTDMF